MLLTKKMRFSNYQEPFTTHMYCTSIQHLTSQESMEIFSVYVIQKLKQLNILYVMYFRAICHGEWQSAYIIKRTYYFVVLCFVVVISLDHKKFLWVFTCTLPDRFACHGTDNRMISIMSTLFLDKVRFVLGPKPLFKRLITMTQRGSNYHICVCWIFWRKIYIFVFSITPGHRGCASNWNSCMKATTRILCDIINTESSIGLDQVHQQPWHWSSFPDYSALITRWINDVVSSCV